MFANMSMYLKQTSRNRLAVDATGQNLTGSQINTRGLFDIKQQK